MVLSVLVVLMQIAMSVQQWTTVWTAGWDTHPWVECVKSALRIVWNVMTLQHVASVRKVWCSWMWWVNVYSVRQAVLSAVHLTSHNACNVVQATTTAQASVHNAQQAANNAHLAPTAQSVIQDTSHTQTSVFWYATIHATAAKSTNQTTAQNATAVTHWDLIVAVLTHHATAQAAVRYVLEVMCLMMVCVCHVMQVITVSSAQYQMLVSALCVRVDTS